MGMYKEKVALLPLKLSPILLSLVVFIMTYYRLISYSQAFFYIIILLSHVLFIRLWRRAIYYYYTYSYGFCQSIILFLISYVRTFNIYDPYVIIAGLAILLLLIFFTKEFISPFAHSIFMDNSEGKLYVLVVLFFVIFFILLFIPPNWFGPFRFLLLNSYLSTAWLFWILAFICALLPVAIIEDETNEPYLYILPQGFGWAIVYLFFARYNLWVNLIFYIASGIIVYYYLKNYIHREFEKLREMIKQSSNGRCLIQNFFKCNDPYDLLVLCQYFRPILPKHGMRIYAEHGSIYIEVIGDKSD